MFFDTVQMPLNPLDPNFRSFESNVLPAANERGIAVLGMKSMGGSGELISKGAFTPSQALSYAMSLPVATTVGAAGAVGQAATDRKLEAGARYWRRHYIRSDSGYAVRRQYQDRRSS